MENPAFGSSEWNTFWAKQPKAELLKALTRARQELITSHTQVVGLTRDLQERTAKDAPGTQAIKQILALFQKIADDENPGTFVYQDRVREAQRILAMVQNTPNMRKVLKKIERNSRRRNKITVALEDIESAQALIENVNNADLEDIRWTRFGRPVDVASCEISGWKHRGLSNLAFAVTALIHNLTPYRHQEEF